MPDILRPIDKFTSPAELGEIATRVNYMVNEPATKRLLRARHLPGVQARHTGDVDASVRNLQRARKHHQEKTLGLYAVMNERGDVAGLASIYPRLPLKQQRGPIWPMLAFGPLSKDVTPNGPDVTVWTNEILDVSNHNPTDEKGTQSMAMATLLHDAYEQLISPEGPVSELCGPEANAWTIEPSRAPQWVHVAIQYAGLKPRQSARFDDAESRKMIPPQSLLYSAQRLSGPAT
jgi:hypothetical protein